MNTVTFPIVFAVLISVLFASASIGRGQEYWIGPNDPRLQAKDNDTLILQRRTVRDPWINNSPAYSILVPKDWQFSGEVVWNPQEAFYPASARFMVKRPESPQAMFLYPRLTFVDGIRESAMRIGGPWLASRYPEGSRYMGDEVRQRPADPAGYVRNIIVPRYRPDLRGGRIVQVWEIPQLAQTKAAAAQGVPGLQVRTQRVRVAYSINGLNIEEDFVCTLYAAPILQTVGWQGECESYSAKAGEVDAAMPLFRTIASSFQIDLQWFADVAAVGELIKQRHFNEVANAAALSRHLAANQVEISDTIRRSYEERSRVIDHCNAQFDRMIRGVQRCIDPSTNRAFEAPSNYAHVFVNGSGDMIVTNNHLYNPNQGWREDWREARASQ